MIAMEETADSEQALESPSEDSDIALMQEWEAKITRPDEVERILKQRAEDREYYTKKVFSDDSGSVVAVNLLARFVAAKSAMVFPPAPWTRARIRQSSLSGVSVDSAKYIGSYGRTVSRVVDLIWNEARGTKILRGAVADCVGTGAEVLKIIWQKDRKRDPLGRRMDDAQDQFERLRMLSTGFQDGEFGRDDAKYSELIQLSDFARRMAIKEETPVGWDSQAIGASDSGTPLSATLAPEIENWQGASLDRVNLDDLFLDWDTVQRTEDFSRGRWMIERVWMARSSVRARWNLTADEAKKLGGALYDGSNPGEKQKQMTAQAEGQREVDPKPETQTTRNGGRDVAVFEVWDRENFRHLVWVPGLKRFLVNECVEIYPEQFFPYFLITLGRTDGQVYPTSDVHFGVKIQREINQILTDLNQARVASLPRFVAEKGSMSPEDAEALQAAVPWTITWVEPSGKDALEKVKALPTTQFQTQLFNILEHIRMIEMVMGVPVSALGVTGTANYAAEVNSAESHLAGQSDVSQERVTETQQEMAQALAELANQALEPATVRAMVLGDMAWPMPKTREQLFRFLHLEVKAGGNNKQKIKDDLETATKSADALMKLTEIEAKAKTMGRNINIEPIAESILEALDLRKPLEEVFSKIEMMTADPKQGQMPMQMPNQMPNQMQSPASGPPALPGQLPMQMPIG